MKGLIQLIFPGKWWQQILDSILMAPFNVYFLFWANVQHSWPTPLLTGLYLSLSPWSSPCVKLSIGAFYGVLSQIERAWHCVTVTYHPHLCHDHHVHIGTVTYHRPQESKAQVGSPGDNCRGARGWAKQETEIRFISITSWISSGYFLTECSAGPLLEVTFRLK